MSHPTSSNMPGIIAMLGGMFCLAAMDATGKWIVEADYPVYQMLAMRSAMIVPAILIYTAIFGGIGQLGTKKPKLFVFRAVITFGAPILYFSALKFMPLADATVLFFGSPLFLTILSIPIFKDKVGIHRWGAVIFGFIGVLIVLRPTDQVFQPAGLMVLLASLSYACSMIMARILGKTETLLRIVFYNNLGLGVMAGAVAVFVWVPMAWEHVAIIGLMAALALSGHLLITRAIVVAPISVVVPFEYSAALWAVIWGYFIFGDTPAANVFLGAAVVIAAGIYIIHREQKNARAQVTVGRG